MKDKEDQECCRTVVIGEVQVQVIENDTDDRSKASDDKKEGDTESADDDGDGGEPVREMILLQVCLCLTPSSSKE